MILSWGRVHREEHLASRPQHLDCADPAALADRIADLRDRFDQLGPIRDAAHDRIVNDFSMARYCHALEEIYDGLA